MARYIDVDNFRKTMIKRFGCIPCLTDYSEASRYDIPLIDALNLAPTADVVPKSEVIRALNEVELLIIITKEMYKQQMEDAPNELSKQSKRTKWVAFEKFYEQFDELKKKYTGENEDEDKN